MTEAEMREQAYEFVRLHTDADCVPVICDEIPGILDRNRRASIWAAATAYSVGDRVQLYPSNGHRYIAISAGTSAATFAAFPTGSGNMRDSYWVTDGTVEWQQAGAAYPNVYDLRAAVHEGWMIKAAKASLLINQTGVSAGDLQAQCRERARDYAPVGVA